jgi:hypothetical protein
MEAPTPILNATRIEHEGALPAIGLYESEFGHEPNVRFWIRPNYERDPKASLRPAKFEIVDGRIVITGALPGEMIVLEATGPDTMFSFQSGGMGTKPFRVTRHQRGEVFEVVGPTTLLLVLARSAFPARGGLVWDEESGGDLLGATNDGGMGMSAPYVPAIFAEEPTAYVPDDFVAGDVLATIELVIAPA